MKNIFKSALSLTVAMSLAIMPMEAMAISEKDTYVALGDSISTGYNLKDIQNDLFVHKIEKEYKLDLTNLAVDGMDTTIMLNLLKSEEKDGITYKENIKNAELITISMGGNNLLQPLMKMMKEGLGLDSNATGIELQEAIKNNQNALTILGTSLQNPQIAQSLYSKVELFTKEFPEIIKYIKTLNPNAEIIIQTIYNPLHDVKELSTLSDAVDPFFQVMNKAISEGSILGYKVVDVYEEFKSNNSQVALTNMVEFDVHPNISGNEVIFNAHKKILETQDIFKDISNHWAKDVIKDFAAKGYIEGYGDQTFRPENDITRGQFVCIFNRVFGLTKTSGVVFNDTLNHWAKDQIDIAVTNGIAKGMSNTEFEPDKPITREQVAMMISNYKKLSDTNHDKVQQFSDIANISTWAIDAVEGIVENGYMIGYQDGTFKPLENMSRAEAVLTLSRIK